MDLQNMSRVRKTLAARSRVQRFLGILPLTGEKAPDFPTPCGVSRYRDSGREGTAHGGVAHRRHGRRDPRGHTTTSGKQQSENAEPVKGILRIGLLIPGGSPKSALRQFKAGLHVVQNFIRRNDVASSEILSRQEPGEGG